MRRRLRDQLRDAPVWTEEDGRRSILLPFAFVRGIVYDGGSATVEGEGVRYSIADDVRADLVVRALADPSSMSERSVAVLRRMSTDAEWREAEAVVAAVRPEPTP